jgi:hypothetical protein
MTVRDVIVAHGVFAHGRDSDGITDAWEEAGFGADEADEWLKARCFSPSAARDLADAEVTTDAARMRTSARIRRLRRHRWLQSRERRPRARGGSRPRRRSLSGAP